MCPTEPERLRHCSIRHPVHLPIRVESPKPYWISALVRFPPSSLSSSYASCLILKVTLLLPDCSHLVIQLLLKLADSSSGRSHLTPAVVRIAFDLRRFLESHHRWVREVSEDTKQLIAAITTFNQSPPLPATGIRITSRVGSEPLSYSSEWATNITRLRGDIQIFRDVTSSYRTFEAFRSFLQPRHSSPASSSNSSPDAPPPESPRRPEASRNPRFRNALKNSNQQPPAFTADTSRSSKEPASASSADPASSLNTRKTSAKEVIYPLSIGPNLLATPMDSGLQAAITAAVSAVVTQATNGIRAEIRQELQQAQQNNGQAGQPGPPEPPGPPGSPDGNLNTGGSPSWRPEDLGFLDSKLPASYDPDPMVRDGKNVYYRNVHLFCERIRDLAAIKSEELIRANLNICLVDYALI